MIVYWNYDLLAYWGPRPESETECAARCVKMMLTLAEVDPVYAGWYKRGKTRATATKPLCSMPPDIGEIARIFDRGRHYLGHRSLKDHPRRLCPEMGMSMGAWNNQDEPYDVGLSIFAGGFTPGRSTNKVITAIPKRHMADGGMWTGTEARLALFAVVDAWEPDYAVVADSRQRDAAPHVGHNLRWPWAGWLTYLAPPASSRIKPPEGVLTEHFANGALLVTLCDEPYDSDNPGHIALANAMHAAMRPIQEED